MFIDKLQQATNRTSTENGADTLRSSLNPLVDFFAMGGATRKNPELGLDLFKKAYAFDKEKAVRILFYLRDIRGGQGERQLFKNSIQFLQEHDLSVLKNIIGFVPEYGRYDDLFVLDTSVYINVVMDQLRSDYTNSNPSLLAKWLPSENTSSKETKKLAKKIREALGATPREYRKMLSLIRAKIHLVEQDMSNREFSAIDYEKIPSQASLKYQKAFKRNDNDRYQGFLQAVTKGEKKINASTLFPYQVYNRVREPASDQLWNALPDYTRGNNALVIADVSGSMIGDPMSVSVSLALYFAERNKGLFKDYFMTFSATPVLQKVVGKTLADKMNSIQRANWDMNTNLNLAIAIILKTAIDNECPIEEIPSTLYIISDMEFDRCVVGKTNFEEMERMYTESGYKMPNIVFWNVNARQKNIPVEYNKLGVALVSGLSPSTFRLVVENKTPLDVMNDVISSERYSQIII